jgi:predicted  nucleic acid-binding Zn-ribbon protein
MPDPMITSQPIRTITRNLLEGRLQEQVEQVAMRFEATITRRERELQGLDMRIAQIEDELATITSELQGIETGRPGSQPADGIAERRRARKHGQRCDGFRQRRAQLEEQLRSNREDWARMVAEIEGLERRKVAEAQRLRAVFTHAEAIYNRALVKRHPEGDLVRLMLDTSILRLPKWAERLNTGRPEADPA